MSPVRSVVHDLRTAVWLKSRDLLPTRRSVTVVLAVGYLVLIALLTAGASMLTEFDPVSIENLVIVATPLWLLWAVVPFVGGGGGDVDSSKRLAPYPVSSRVHLFSTWVSALSDFPYVIALPVLVALSLALAGPLGLLVALSFALGASAVGQLGAWAAGALHLRSRGESLGSTVVVVVVLAGLSFSSLSFSSAVDHLPPAFFRSGLQAAAAGDVGPTLGWLLVLLSPVLLVALVAPFLVTRALEVRASGASPRPRPWGQASAPLPQFVALVQLLMRSSLRAISTRALLLSVLAIPFLISLALGDDPINHVSLAVFAALASAATISVNSWAFESSGVQVLLSNPVSPRSLLWSRIVASTLTLLTVVLAVLLASWALEPPSVEELSRSLLVAFGVSALCAITGAASSTKNPVGVDFDSLRARPTTLPAALGFLATTGAAYALLAGVYVALGALSALAVLALGAIFVVDRASRRMRDGGDLVAALA